MKLLCLNVCLFEKNNERLVKLVKETNPDFIALQEVIRGVDQNVDPDYLSLDAVNKYETDYSFFSPYWTLKDFRKSNFHGKEMFSKELGGWADMGYLIKSKYKIYKSSNVFVQGHHTYRTNWENWPEEDHRSVQVTDIEVGGKMLRVLNYHGIWSKDKHGTELTVEANTKIRDLALGNNGPTIICGDFNLFPETESMRILSSKFRSLVDEFNIKTTRPESNELSHLERNVVDFTMVNDQVKVNNFEVVNSDASDHFPLVIDFEV